MRTCAHNPPTPRVSSRLYAHRPFHRSVAFRVQLPAAPWAGSGSVSVAQVCKQGDLARELYFLEEGKLLQWETVDIAEAEQVRSSHTPAPPLVRRGSGVYALLLRVAAVVVVVVIVVVVVVVVELRAGGPAASLRCAQLSGTSAVALAPAAWLTQ